MVWFRTDDGMPSHPKVLSIPRRMRSAALGVWLQAGCWSAHHLTDGFVPLYAIEEIPDGVKCMRALEEAGLWVAKENGYQFHDWKDRQPSREEVLAEREAHAARQKAYRERQKAKRDAESDASRDVNVQVTSDGSDAGVTAARPDPTRPDPTVVPTELPKTEAPTVPSRAKRGTRIPEDWRPSPELVAWTLENCPGIDGRRETMRFRNHFMAQSGSRGVMRDWDAAFRKWMLGAMDRAPTRTPDWPTTARPSRAVANTAAGLELARQFALEAEQEEPQ